MSKAEQQERGRNLRSVWTIATQPYPGSHFATFPEKLVEPCIKAGSKAGDVVLDPFAGSGTVGVVAGKLGRDFIGIDLTGGDKDLGGHTANQRIEAARRGVDAPLAELPVALEQTELFEGDA